MSDIEDVNGMKHIVALTGSEEGVFSNGAP